MTNIPNDDPAIPTADDTRSKRLALERDMLDGARRDLLAGLVIGDDDLDAWLDALLAGEPVDGPEASPTARPRQATRTVLIMPVPAPMDLIPAREHH